MKQINLLATIYSILILTGCNKDDSLSANVVEDETFRSYLLQNFDTDKDGKFSKEEIAAAKTIDVSNRGITSIKGIELFNAIETLKCSKNNLTELNVLKNKSLIYLDCSYNDLYMFITTPMNSKLKYFDYSNNKRIDFFSPNGAKELEYLDLSNTGYSDGGFDMPKLKYLKCANSGLSSLFIPLCTELTYLDFSNNEMSENNPVDLTKNTKLNTLIAEKTSKLKYIHFKQGQTIDNIKIDGQIDIIYCP